MPIPEPFTVAALSAGVLTNLAADILKHYGRALDDTLVGRMLKHAGLIEPNFHDRMQDTLAKALQLYFDQHPDYAISGVLSFFSDLETAQQIGGFVLDRKPIDDAKIQQTLNQHLAQHPLARITIENRGLQLASIVPDFLSSYRQVLNQQLSVPQMAILLEILDQTTVVLAAIRKSEDRLKEHMAQLLESHLSSEGLRTAYEAGQQELAADLTAEVANAGLLRSDEAEQAIMERLRPLPALFTDGLCAGRPLRPAPHQYFVSHGFDRETLQDWREALAETLAHAGGTTEPLRPYFAGDSILAGFKLCGISEKICATRFSTFLLPPSQDRNVYLELGIAIGLGVPFFLIQHYDAEIPPILEGLARYTRGGLFRRMRRELAGQVEEYDFGVVRFVKPQSTAMEPKYLLAAGQVGREDEDFEWSIREALAAAYPQLQAISLKEQNDSGWVLEQLVEAIQSSRFAIYRVDQQCSPTTFLALGISIGANRPFLMVHHERSQVPENLRGIRIHQFISYVGLEKEFVSSCRAFLNKHAHNSIYAEVSVTVKGDLHKFSKLDQANFISLLSQIINLKPDEIRILNISSGSILLVLHMPESAAQKLVSMYLKGHPALETLGIERIELMKTSSSKPGYAISGRTIDIHNISGTKQLVTHDKGGIPGGFAWQLRTALAECDQFDTDQSLRAVFVHDSLRPWRNGLPEASSIQGRVFAVINYLHDKHHRDGSNALVVLLQVLSSQYDPLDERHDRLGNLAVELAAYWSH